MSVDPTLRFSTVEKAVSAIARGEVVIVVDDEDRENEGTLFAQQSQLPPKRSTLC